MANWLTFWANPSLDVRRKQMYAPKNATKMPILRELLNPKLALSSGTVIEDLACKGGTR
jgi:hypothetical protein